MGRGRRGGIVSGVKDLDAEEYSGYSGYSEYSEWRTLMQRVQ
jgi:hypothetical protein